MTWNTVWLKLFGVTSLWGLDMGFWVALAAVMLIVILMNVVFWGMKPAKKPSSPDAVPRSSAKK